MNSNQSTKFNIFNLSVLRYIPGMANIRKGVESNIYEILWQILSTPFKLSILFVGILQISIVSDINTVDQIKFYY
jgi:hypothetical protein